MHHEGTKDTQVSVSATLLPCRVGTGPEGDGGPLHPL